MLKTFYDTFEYPYEGILIPVDRHALVLRRDIVELVLANLYTFLTDEGKPRESKREFPLPTGMLMQSRDAEKIWRLDYNPVQHNDRPEMFRIEPVNVGISPYLFGRQPTGKDSNDFSLNVSYLHYSSSCWVTIEVDQRAHKGGPVITFDITAEEVPLGGNYYDRTETRVNLTVYAEDLVNVHTTGNLGAGYYLHEFDERIVLRNVWFQDSYSWRNPGEDTFLYGMRAEYELVDTYVGPYSGLDSRSNHDFFTWEEADWHHAILPGDHAKLNGLVGLDPTVGDDLRDAVYYMKTDGIVDENAYYEKETEIIDAYIEESIREFYTELPGYADDVFEDAAVEVYDENPDNSAKLILAGVVFVRECWRPDTWEDFLSDAWTVIAGLREGSDYPAVEHDYAYAPDKFWMQFRTRMMEKLLGKHADVIRKEAGVIVKRVEFETQGGDKVVAHQFLFA